MIPVISAILPCFGRPQRTWRMLQCCLSQSLKGWELILIGDACPDFQNIMQSREFQEWKEKFYRRGNSLFTMNLASNRGGHGAHIVNVGIRIARGKYFCWLNNDDMVHAEHLQFYYQVIQNEKGNVDFMYCPTLINSPEGFDIRYPELKFGSVGHSELVVNTKFLRTMPAHRPEYGQDWQVIEEMMKSGSGKKGNPPFPTYMVMSTPRYPETGID
jgi:hypothetical protein